jgi:hypothetical protein
LGLISRPPGLYSTFWIQNSSLVPRFIICEMLRIVQL